MDSPNGGSHLHEIIMFTMHACACMCMHVHACMRMHVHMCVGHPNHPLLPLTYPPPPTPYPPELQGAQNTKIQ